MGWKHYNYFPIRKCQKSSKYNNSNNNNILKNSDNNSTNNNNKNNNNNNNTNEPEYIMSVVTPDYPRGWLYYYY